MNSFIHLSICLFVWWGRNTCASIAEDSSIHLFVCLGGRKFTCASIVEDLWALSPVLFLICHQNIISFPMHALMTSPADSNMSTSFITLVSSIIPLKQSSQAGEKLFSEEALSQVRLTDLWLDKPTCQAQNCKKYWMENYNKKKIYTKKTVFDCNCDCKDVTIMFLDIAFWFCFYTAVLFWQLVGIKTVWYLSKHIWISVGLM